MTEKESIEIIKNTPLLRYEGQCGLHSELGDAMRMAVEVLEKQTMVNEILHDWDKAIAVFSDAIKREIRNCSWQFGRLEESTIDAIAERIKNEET